MNRISVAVGVICDAEGRILISKRPLGRYQSNLWEFPGGKLEGSETAREALERELYEELGITIVSAEWMLNLSYNYPDQLVDLIVFRVSRFYGVAWGAEGQNITWVKPSMLKEYTFPAANFPIITTLCLPTTYYITPNELTNSQLLLQTEKALKRGVRLIQLRLLDCSADRYERLAQQMFLLCQGRAQLMLKGSLSDIQKIPSSGWHLTSNQLKQLSADQISFRLEKRPPIVAASCHSMEQLEQAEQLKVDFVTLSPVCLTESHPDSTPLGWDVVEQYIKQTSLPIYLLGGLTLSDINKSKNIGAQGVSGIRSFWPK